MQIFKIKRYAEKVSRWQAPLINGKFCVAFLQLITQGSGFFSMVSIHLVKPLLKPNFISAAKRK